MLAIIEETHHDIRPFWWRNNRIHEGAGERAISRQKSVNRHNITGDKSAAKPVGQKNFQGNIRTPAAKHLVGNPRLSSATVRHDQLPISRLG